jgi:radical SAM superfamily enzyme YgiQ (UPF0313 family)
MRICYAAVLPSKSDWRFVRPPLFAGYLAAYASLHRSGLDEHIIIDPTEMKRLGRVTEIAKHIINQQPELVALTVFVWNHLRVAELCNLLKRAIPRVRIVLGGPEVAFTPVDALDRFNADWICTGEGEIAFLSLVNELHKDRQFSLSLPGLLYRDDPTRIPSVAPMIKNLDDIPSPYLSGHLKYDSDGFVDLETTRGCPYRCRFCLYGKTFDSLRHFSLERTELDVAAAIANGATTIYLMDPTFNYPRERCRKVCKILAKLNVDRKVEFHTEARAEVMDPALADDFVRAGVKFVEIGLQSTSKETLKLMKRGLGTSHFLRGCKLLSDRGITIEIGMIAGLPGDTSESVRDTAKFVIENRLGELTVHRLQMLPGSDYFKMASELGLVYLRNPPYYIQHTPTMTRKNILGVVEEMDNLARSPNKKYIREVKAKFETIRRRERRILKCVERFVTNIQSLDDSFRRFARSRKFQERALMKFRLRRDEFRETLEECVVCAGEQHQNIRGFYDRYVSWCKSRLEGREFIALYVYLSEGSEHKSQFDEYLEINESGESIGDLEIEFRLFRLIAVLYQRGELQIEPKYEFSDVGNENEEYHEGERGHGGGCGSGEACGTEHGETYGSKGGLLQIGNLVHS